MMLDIKNLSIELIESSRFLLKDFSFVLNKGDKVAIIGEEGNGKSTLIKAIYDVNLINTYCYVDGIINNHDLKIGLLPQNLEDKWLDVSICDYLLKDEPGEMVDYQKYNELSTIKQQLSKFHFSSSIIESLQPLRELSGGEKVKVMLIKILMNELDLLLLDEPSNDLDIETLEWLENFIMEYEKPLIFISHDETLLEKTANMIIHMEQLYRKKEERHTIEKSSYVAYVNNRSDSFKKQDHLAKKQRMEYKKQRIKLDQLMNRVHHEQNMISRGDPAGARLLKKKMKSLKSMERRFENDYQDFEDFTYSEEAMNLQFESFKGFPKTKEILKIELKELIVDKKVLAKNIKLVIRGSEKIVITGKNGVGKTTLLKMIHEDLKKRSDLNVAYLPQDYSEVLDENITPIEFLCQSGLKEDIDKAYLYLGSCKFTFDEMNKAVNKLSYGQKSKLIITKMILDNANVLLLDEPTRNLSPLSNPVLRKQLSNFDGVIISVSHDRKYIEEVCDKRYILTRKGLILYEKNEAE